MGATDLVPGALPRLALLEAPDETGNGQRSSLLQGREHRARPHKIRAPFWLELATSIYLAMAEKLLSHFFCLSTCLSHAAFRSLPLGGCAR